MKNKEKFASLCGKTVAITGSTGGLGKEICKHLASLGASLVLLDRSRERSEAWRNALCRDFPNISVQCIRTELEDIQSVKAACEQLKELPLDILILNAGAYAIPRHKTSMGFDNIFQINYASPYVMTKELLLTLRARRAKVVAVGSIAHRYSKTDMSDVDFSMRNGSALAYGNSKRHLMLAMWSLFESEENVSLSVVHPGITFTNITAHYPPWLFAIIKYPMKIIFPCPRVAARCIVQGIFEDCDSHSHEWLGPSLFDIWGAPKHKRLKKFSPKECEQVASFAQRLNAEYVHKA